MQQTVLIIGFNRPSLLRNCLRSVVSSFESSNFRKVIVLQKGDVESESVVDDFRSQSDLTVYIDGSGLSTVENISRNRYLGYSLCFDLLRSDLVVALEEDVEISADALFFAQEMHKTYEKNRSYKGINLGSAIPRNEAEPDTYSLIRYGVMGPASAITSRSWKNFDFKKLMENKYSDWDGTMEDYFKTGFMVTPNLSRYVDLGVNGAHANPHINGTYFSQLNESFVGSFQNDKKTYTLKSMPHRWRKDAIPWKLSQNFIYIVRKMVLSKKSGRFVAKKFSRGINKTLI